MGDPEPRDLKKRNLPILPVFYPFPVNPIEMGQKFQRHSTQRSKIHKKHLGFGQNSAKNFLPLFASAYIAPILCFWGPMVPRCNT